MCTKSNFLKLPNGRDSIGFAETAGEETHILVHPRHARNREWHRLCREDRSFVKRLPSDRRNIWNRLPAYEARLCKFLENKNRLVVLEDQGREAETAAWLQGINPEVRIAMISTDKDSSLICPAVSFKRYGGRCSWDVICEALKSFGIDSAKVSGCYHNNGAYACIYWTLYHLRRLGLNPKATKHCLAWD